MATLATTRQTPRTTGQATEAGLDALLRDVDRMGKILGHDQAPDDLDDPEHQQLLVRVLGDDRDPTDAVERD